MLRQAHTHVRSHQSVHCSHIQNKDFGESPGPNTVKTVLSSHSERRPKINFQDRLSLNEGQKYCRMLLGSILQYFCPSFSYHVSLRPLFCIFLSGRLRQVLLNRHPAPLDSCTCSLKEHLGIWNSTLNLMKWLIYVCTMYIHVCI